MLSLQGQQLELLAAEWKGAVSGTSLCWPSHNKDITSNNDMTLHKGNTGGTGFLWCALALVRVEAHSVTRH